MKVSMSSASEKTVTTAQLLDGEVEDADSSGVAEAGISCHGLSLLSLEAIKESSVTLRMMTTLFRVSTGLDLFLFYRCPSTGQWREKGFCEPIQLSHFCRLVRSTRKGLERCRASHRINMEKVVRDPCLTSQRCHVNLLDIRLPVATTEAGPAYIGTVGAVDEQGLPEQFEAMYKGMSDLGFSDVEIRESMDEVPIVSKSTLEQVEEWLSLFASYLADVSADLVLSSREVEPKENRPAPSRLEERIRRHIACHVLLPPPHSNRSCGCSAALIERLTSFLGEYYYLPLSTQLIALALGFESSYLGKTFKKHMEISLPVYRKRVRLFRAKKLLEDPYLSIAEIAGRTGFSDASYFTRVFHGAFGLTPSDFRNLTEESPDRLVHKMSVFSID